MRADSAWISLKEAIDLVEEVRFARHIAMREILDALVNEQLVAKAGRFTVKIIPQDGLKEVEEYGITTIRADSWRALVNQRSEPDQAVEWYHSRWFLFRSILRNGFEAATVCTEAHEISVPLLQIKKIWGIDSKPKSSRRGGRPEEHNWSAAFAYCGWWVAQNGLPDKKVRLTELIIEWFRSEDGGAPDDENEIKRRSIRAYDELARRIQKNDSGV